ncbi:MAG: hypothetical protein LBM98_02800 [Oscillospiraceae bacterium]|nr:hypothetical protein [Oscillospiraceae bacterium]
MRSTGKPAIRRALQVRSNPVPGGKHTVYVSQDTTSTLDCFAAYHLYVPQVRWRLRKDGQGVALPSCGGGRFADTLVERWLRTVEGGFETRPYVFTRNQRPNPRPQPNVQTHRL